MNKLRLLALWCVAAFAAGCAPQPVTVTGTVCDATANGLMLAAPSERSRTPLNGNIIWNLHKEKTKSRK